jgi:hypothetical protein
VASPEIEPKDVVLAIMTASAAIAGLVLVFFGLVVAAYADHEPTDQSRVVWKYRRVGIFLLSDFAVGIVCMAAATVWFLTSDRDYYGLSIGAFILQLILLALGTGVTAWEMLWRE